MPTTHSFVLAIAMPKEQEQGSSVSTTVTVNDGSGAAISPSVNQLIKSSVAESIGALTDNLTRVIEDLGGFAKRFSEENSSTVEQAIKKALRESYNCKRKRKRKRNQQQLDYVIKVLVRFNEASDALKAKSHDKVKAALDAGTEVVSKRIKVISKVIKMADKSDFGHSTVNEYLLDELTSNSDDEKRMYKVERRAERKNLGQA